MRKHPDIARRYPDLPPYMIARRIIADLTNGRVGHAVNGYRANRAAASLGYSMPQLLWGYFRGRRRRRNLHREFREKFGPRPERD
jgi:hypothetical protein